jgi:hypothetical protein
MQKSILEKLNNGSPNFHRIACEEYFFAMLDGKNHDSEYVKKKTYARYEEELKASKNKTSVV